MTTPSIRLVAACLVLCQVACVGFAIPGTRRKPGEADIGRKVYDNDGLGAPAFLPKPVIGKQPPHLLLARDRTECVVSAEKFEKTVIGTSVWCVWTDAHE